ncbi:MAG: hypothetical protein D6729_05595 [Deltaproteobacteria bacterium]|nr:MAG: hypothetical protein D6729_05595 [Deltaproteobacteria bacterium]
MSALKPWLPAMLLLGALTLLPAGARADEGWRVAPRFGLLIRQGAANTRIMTPSPGVDLEMGLSKHFGLRLSYGLGFKRRGTSDTHIFAVDNALTVLATAGTRFHPSGGLFVGLGAGAHLLLFDTSVLGKSQLGWDAAPGLAWIGGIRLYAVPGRMTVDFAAQGLLELENHRLQFYVAVAWRL